MFSIPDNITKVRACIQHASAQNLSKRDDITLIAASKTRSVKEILTAHDAGIHHFGENYLQEALNKISQINKPAIIWHFIGPIQSNKTRDIAEHFHWAHSVDRLKIAQRLSQQRPRHLTPLQICLQVNIDNEAQKAGVRLDELESLARTVSELPNLSLRGLMCIPAATNNAEQQFAAFTKMQLALEQLQQIGVQSPLDTLSMGMSDDIAQAITAGSTMVRVGTAIFGPRHQHREP